MKRRFWQSAFRALLYNSKLNLLSLNIIHTICTQLMNSIVKKYNDIQGDAELELSYSLNMNIYHRLLDIIETSSIGQEMIQHLDIYHTDSTRRTMIFVNGINQKQDMYIQKELLAKPIWLEQNIKLK